MIDVRREGIVRFKLYRALAKFSVVLRDGRLGVGPTIGEALANAKQPDAENILRAA